MHPLPAAVMAWHHSLSWRSPALKTPSTDVASGALPSRPRRRRAVVVACSLGRRKIRCWGGGRCRRRDRSLSTFAPRPSRRREARSRRGNPWRYPWRPRIPRGVRPLSADRRQRASRHHLRRPEALAADDEVDVTAVFGEIQRLFHGSVAAANHREVLVLERREGPSQMAHALMPGTNIAPRTRMRRLGRGARGEDDAVRANLALGTGHHERSGGEIDALDVLAVQHRAPSPRCCRILSMGLGPSALGNRKFSTSVVVMKLAAGDAASLETLEHHGVEVRAAGVDGGGVSRGAAADYHHALHVVVVRRGGSVGRCGRRGGRATAARKGARGDARAGCERKTRDASTAATRRATARVTRPRERRQRRRCGGHRIREKGSLSETMPSATQKGAGRAREGGSTVAERESRMRLRASRHDACADRPGWRPGGGRGAIEHTLPEAAPPLSISRIARALRYPRHP